jgi:hypothetical protein
MIILHTKDLTDDDRKLFQRYGRVLEWSDVYVNIDINTLDFDYLFCNIINKMCLRDVQKMVHSDFNICCYCSFYEVDNQMFDDGLNIHQFTKFPKQTAYKEDFNKALLNKNLIEKPNKMLSCASFFLNVWSKFQRK